jgi:endoglucanase
MTRIKFWILLLLTIGIVFGFSVYSRRLSDASSISIPALNQGVSTSAWFFAPPDRDFSKAHLDGWVTEKDFKQLSDWGAKHIRLPIEPNFLQTTSPPYQLLPEKITYIDRAINWAKKYKLAIILDMHPLPPADVLKLEDGTRSRDYERLRQLWIALAKRYRWQPETVFYELLNESGVQSLSSWKQVAQGLVNEIRAIDPRHSIIVTGPSWGGAYDLGKMTPLKGRKLIYTFHFYQPFMFTHQGWRTEWLENVRGVPYPFNAERLTRLKESIQDPKIRYILAAKFHDYESRQYSKTQLFEEMRPAIEFRNRYGVPVYCGEFGVHRAAFNDDRYRWHKDVVDLLKQYQIGYSLWEYRGAFGIMPFESKEIDQALLKSIGLGPST